MNILHVTGKLNIGGVEKWLLNMIKEDKDNNFIILSHGGDDQAYLGKDFITAGALVIPYIFSKNIFKDFLFFKKIIRENKIDIVHSHLYFFSALIMLYAFFSGVKVRVVHIHSIRNEKKSLNRKLFLFFMKILMILFSNLKIAVSKKVGENFFDNTKYYVIPCGVALDDFVFSKTNNQNNNLIHIGRFVPEKNHKFLINLMKLLVEDNKNYILYLIGDGPLRFEIEKMVKDLDLSDNVKFLGIQNNIGSILNEVGGTFLFPSFWEGLGIVAIESQLCGLPCICSKNIPEDINIGGAIFLNDYNLVNWKTAIYNIINQNFVLNENLKNYDIKYNVKYINQIYGEI